MCKLCVLEAFGTYINAWTVIKSFTVQMEGKDTQGAGGRVGDVVAHLHSQLGIILQSEMQGDEEMSGGGNEDQFVGMDESERDHGEAAMALMSMYHGDMADSDDDGDHPVCFGDEEMDCVRTLSGFHNLTKRSVESGIQHAALVGQKINKYFVGHGTHTGIVTSYDNQNGNYMVNYEDGDSETMTFSQLSHYLDRSHDSAEGGAVSRRHHTAPQYGGASVSGGPVSADGGSVSLHHHTSSDGGATSRRHGQREDVALQINSHIENLHGIAQRRKGMVKRGPLSSSVHGGRSKKTKTCQEKESTGIIDNTSQNPTTISRGRVRRQYALHNASDGEEHEKEADSFHFHFGSDVGHEKANRTPSPKSDKDGSFSPGRR